LNWENGGCETGAFKNKIDFNRQPLLGGDFFTRMNCEMGRFYPV
jgi:hypothetical protein